MKLTTSEKIRLICKRSDISISELAKRLDISIQNLSNKLTRDNFTERDIEKIAKALECEYQSLFIMNDGTEI